MAVPGLSASITLPAIGAVSSAGCSNATICGLPVASPKRTRDSAAFPRTSGDGSFSILSNVSWKAAPDVSCPSTHASVLRTSSTAMRCETNEIRVPLRDRGVVTRHSFTDLDQRMLDVPWMGVVV